MVEDARDICRDVIKMVNRHNRRRKGDAEPITIQDVLTAMLIADIDRLSDKVDAVSVELFKMRDG